MPGVTVSRAQANFEMQQARMRNSPCPCPPSNPSGGVTGSNPATGSKPLPLYSRQNQLHSRLPQGQVAKLTGDNPCGGNSDSSQNTEQVGQTGNPTRQPAPRNFMTGPNNPYQQNPLELPSGQRTGPATNGSGQPTTQAISDTDCPACGGGDNPYQRGYGAAQADCDYTTVIEGRNCEIPDDRSVSYPDDVQNDPIAHESYFQGYVAGVRDFGRPRRRSLYNTRPRAGTNLRRGVARFV